MKRHALKSVFWIVRVLRWGKNGTWRSRHSRIPLMLQPGSSCLTPLSLCLPSWSATKFCQVYFFLACKSVPILPHASFGFSLYIISNTLSFCLSFCSHSLCVIHMLLPRWYFRENYHCFPDISSIAPAPTIEILCYQQSKQDALFSLPTHIHSS